VSRIAGDGNVNRCVREYNSLKPNSITLASSEAELASSELDPNMFGASSELASVMKFGFYTAVCVQHLRGSL